MASAAAKKPMPWRGRKRVSDPKSEVISVRCTPADREMMEEGAESAGLAVGSFLRALGVGSPGPRAVRRPGVERVQLAQLLGHIGKLGSNVNQIARLANTDRVPPRGQELSLMQADIAAMRVALMQALGRGD